MKKNLYKTSEKFGKEDHHEINWDIYQKFLRIIKFNKKEKILDAGCGNGELGSYLKGFNLFGFDFNDKAVKNARKKSYKKVVKSEIYSLPFKDKEYDKTICIQVFQYLEKPEKAFKELLRVTNKNIIITVPNFKWLKISSYLSKKHKTRYEYCIKHENYTDNEFLEKLSKKNKIPLEIKYLSNKFSLIRNIFGKYFSSEIIGIYNLK
tara:strand:- start:389 stop:1009 length:621 start_codon:yes stop_codon:yes gene_type:complete